MCSKGTHDTAQTAGAANNTVDTANIADTAGTADTASGATDAVAATVGAAPQAAMAVPPSLAGQAHAVSLALGPLAAEQGLPPITVCWLPANQDFSATWAAMRAYTEQRDAQSPDQIWLLEHAPVYTLGQAGRAEHILNPGAIPIVHTDRGGQVTYHGPGQLVAYCLFDLRRYGLYVKSYVALLERVIVDTLADFGAHYACLQPGAPGVYVPAHVSATGSKGGQHPDELVKIAALGVKISKGRTYHGIAINVDMDLTPFTGINPCGYSGLRTTDLAHCGIDTTVPEVGQQLLKHMQQAFSHCI